MPGQTPAAAAAAECSDGDHSVFDILKENFDAAYNGNRAPFPIFIHTPWLKDHKGDVQQFAGGLGGRLGPSRWALDPCVPAHWRATHVPAALLCSWAHSKATCPASP